MTRRLRINLPGGWYHVTARGNECRAIYRDDGDRKHFLDLAAETVELFQVQLHAYVLMPNHYHLLLELPEGESEVGVALQAPHATRVKRLDEVQAARRPILRWKP